MPSFFPLLNDVKCQHDVCRSLKKRVGEYQKLTGSLPGIWRLAQESNERATKAESSLKEAQVSLSFGFSFKL